MFKWIHQCCAYTNKVLVSCVSHRFRYATVNLGVGVTRACRKDGVCVRWCVCFAATEHFYTYVNVCECVYVHPCVHLQAPMSLEQNKCSLRCTEKQKHIHEVWRSYMSISKISLNLSFIPLIQSLFLHSLCHSFLYFLCHSLSAIITFNLDRGRDVVFPRLCCWHNALGCDVDQANCATVISVFHRPPYHQETRGLSLKVNVDPSFVVLLTSQIAWFLYIKKQIL